ncbi:efflux RND transporter periplasmic adaptor subunit [Chitinophaga niabensis]|uniref:Membrane fusion protein, cobalt-zinc-cadmium efflux system n=1 Tax=Chitinophaga niabensis TaxID=536979 RepID=A0A1N6DM60_9BACT|nr:efflux RND transporter periplasmic adaptor subunit [Chitinophaga niabensis]SIN71909.1 membrane fusion protein, cobalt-zinc-cadmium efflux system [Chitinophaga niabensis]
MKQIKILWIGAALASCQQATPVPIKEVNPLPDSLIRQLQTAPAKLEEMTDLVKLNGKIVPTEQQQAKVYALVSGRIGTVKVELGDMVQKGQVLATLESSEVAAVNNDLSLANANAEMALKNMETRRSLYQGSLITEQEYLSAQIEYNKAKSELEKAQQINAITGGNSKAGYTVKAPISGSIIEKNITGNSEVRQDNNSNLFTIADLSTVWVIANVYESDINSIHLNDPVIVSTLANPDKEYAGRVDKIYNVLDAVSRTMKVRISMPNKNNELKPEMFARVYLSSRIGGTPQLCIPAKAVVMDNSKRYVVVKKDASLAIREIRVIKRVDDKAFIEGLTAGENVVTQSQVFIYDALNVK